MTIKKINNIHMNKIIFFGACFSVLIACSPKTTQTGPVVEPVTKTFGLNLPPKRDGSPLGPY